MSDQSTNEQAFSNKQNVIFLCTGNSARSQMCEGFLRAYAGDRYSVYSAGIEPKGINPYAVRVMREEGIDISAQESSSISDYMGHLNFAAIFTVCEHAEANCPRTFLMSGQAYPLEFGRPGELSGSGS